MLKKIRDVTIGDILKMIEKAGCDSCSLASYCGSIGNLFCTPDENMPIEPFLDEEVEVVE